MLTVEQVNEKAPVKIDLWGKNYCYRCLYCICSESGCKPGIVVLQGFKMEIGDRDGEELSKDKIARLFSNESLIMFTEFINTGIDISIEGVLRYDSKEISKYVYPRVALPEFLDMKIIKLD